MSRPQRTFADQFNAAMSRAYLWERCRELSRVLPLASTSKELNQAFVQVCADIFGYAAGGNAGFGWNLTSLTKNQVTYYQQTSSSRDYLAAFSFLSSTGPLMDLIHKLLSDPSNVYEYSITHLPTVEIAANSQQNQYGVTGSIALTSFEYFFYHFFNLPIRAQMHSMGYNSNNANVPQDTLYPVLLEDYLAHFLPIDPIQQAKLFSQTLTPPVAPVQHMLHQTSTPIQSQNRSSLFRKGFSPTAASHTESVIASGCTQTNARETWRLDTIVRTISMFWIEPFAQESAKRAQAAANGLMSSPTDDGFVNAALRIAASLPSIGLMRCIRMFVKHAHYFSNSCKVGAGTLYLPMSLKINIFGDHINTDIMLHFFKHVIGHWPMDSSFRFILETWLSYIQPWRYFYTPQGQITDENSQSTMEHPEQWITFLRENFQFYNSLMGQVLYRFFKQDVTSSKNAHMIFRVFKVLTQDHLIPSLRTVSSLLIGNCLPSSSLNACNYSPMHQPHYQKSLADTWDPSSDNELTNMFGPDFKSFMTQLLVKILDSKLNEQETLQQRKFEVGAAAKKEQNEDILAKICKFLAGKDCNNSSQESEFAEREKMIQNLDFTIEKIADIFQLSSIVEEFSDRFFEEKERRERTLEMASKSDFDISSTDGFSFGLSPSQRLDLINKRRKPDLRHTGNPDLLPIRTDEITFLVRSLHKVSQVINKKHGDFLSDFYHRKSPAGALVRQICQPPVTFFEKTSFGARHVNRLPPRICLRPLASYRTVFNLFLFFFVCLVIFGKSILGSFLLLLVFYVAYLVIMAFIVKPIDPETSFLNQSSDKKFE